MIEKGHIVNYEDYSRFAADLGKLSKEQRDWWVRTHLDSDDDDDEEDEDDEDDYD